MSEQGPINKKYHFRQAPEKATPSRYEVEFARDRFSDLIASRAPEHSFQRLFAECPFILSAALPIRLAPIDIVPMGTVGRSEPDFVFYPRSPKSVGEFGVIEIKRPDSIIATIVRKNIVTLSRDAETAISQSEFFLHNLDGSSLLKPKNSIVLGNKGYIFVIMGLSEQLNQILIDDLMTEQLERRIPANCRLLPYDVVLDHFTKTIDTRIYFLVPAIERNCRIGIMDGAIRFGNKDISNFLSELILTQLL